MPAGDGVRGGIVPRTKPDDIFVTDDIGGVWARIVPRAPLIFVTVVTPAIHRTNIRINFCRNASKKVKIKNKNKKQYKKNELNEYFSF